MVCYDEPVAVNDGDFDEPEDVNHGVLCIASGCES
jgi:hypothetical protein